MFARATTWIQEVTDSTRKRFRRAEKTPESKKPAPTVDPSLIHTAATSEAFQKLIEEHGVDAALKYMSACNEAYKEVELKIVVIGQVNAGKSAFINSYRGMTNDEAADAAKVNVIEETFDIRAFPHPRNTKVVLYDAPGVGNPSYSFDDYKKLLSAQKFDFYVLICGSTFPSIYCQIIKFIVNLDKPFVFIRSHIDEAIRNDRRSRPSTHNAKEVMNVVRAEIAGGLFQVQQDLLAEGCSSASMRRLATIVEKKKIFLIDNYDQQAFDYDALRKELENDLPTVQRDALVLTLKATTEEIIERKVRVLERALLVPSSLSALIAAIPIPGTSLVADTLLIQQQITYFIDQMGLNIEDENVSAAAHDSEEKKRIFRTSTIGRLLTPAGVLAVASRIPLTLASDAAEDILKIALPIVGAVAAASVSAASTYFILHKALKDLEKEAKELLRVKREQMSEEWVIADLPANDADMPKFAPDSDDEEFQSALEVLKSAAVTVDKDSIGGRDQGDFERTEKDCTL